MCEHLFPLLKKHFQTPHPSPCVSQGLLQRADTLQSDLEGVLEASKDLAGHLEPSAAVLVQSERRLQSRGAQQLIQALKGKLGHLQVRLHE